MNEQQRLFQLPEGNAKPWVDLARYYLTPRWRAISAALIREHPWCSLCGGRPPSVRLAVHHNTYAHLGAERQGELVVLCSKCHDKHHDKAHGPAV